MIFTILFLVLTFFILTQSETSLYYAFYGFSLWYSKMIPSLLPFMIISGILVRMNLTGTFSGILHPLLKRLYGCSQNVSYAIIMGFLCGFPMGAKVTADLLKDKKITLEEADFLLCFCNNIGPIYFCSFVIPLLHITKPLPFICGMYGIPLLYGVLLRHSYYRHKFNEKNSNLETAKKSTDLLTAMDESIHASIQSILTLCGYMILFNLLNILPHFLLPGIHRFISPFLEITGGLSLLQDSYIPFSMVLLTFGGLSCMAQTHSMICDTQLSMKHYFVHKCILTGITLVYYIFLSHFF